MKKTKKTTMPQKNPHMQSKLEGQSGPRLSLKGSDLRPNERRVMAAFRKTEKLPTNTLALSSIAFKELAEPFARSRVRNALRRLVRSGLVLKSRPGVYRLAHRAISIADELPAT